MIRDNLLYRFGLALVPLVLTASAASAAGSFSNSLTGFTGNSTVPATQTAVAGAGFNFFDVEAVSQVQFDASGAKFGEGIVDTGDLDRNYVRTNDSDYGNVSFVAEITMVAPNIDVQDGYFGLGAGNAVLTQFRTPDWTSPNSSVMYWGETEIDITPPIATPTVDTYLLDNGDGPFVTTLAPSLTNGTHRIRFAYDWFTKSAVFSFDFNYAGGAFVADTTAPAINTLSLYGPDGWPTEPARLYFGGDEFVVFKDFQVAVSTAPVVFGDFNNSGTITSADWAILRANQHADLSGMTLSQSYFLGDLKPDKKNNHDDFVIFKAVYEGANGAGSFAAMLSGVPEPSSLVLTLSAGLMALSVRRRKAERA